MIDLESIAKEFRPEKVPFEATAYSIIVKMFKNFQYYIAILSSVFNLRRCQCEATMTNKNKALATAPKPRTEPHKAVPTGGIDRVGMRVGLGVGCLI